MKNKMITINIVFFCFLLFNSSQVLGQSSYETPDYDLVKQIGVAKLHLEKGYRRFNFGFYPFHESHDGFMLKYSPKHINNNSTGGTKLLKIVNNAKTILEVYYNNTNSSLKLKRYNSNGSVSIDYNFFDRLLSDGAHTDTPGDTVTPIFKFYFGKNFIWIETYSEHFVNGIRYHSPLFWGLDIDDNSKNMKSFLGRTPGQGVSSDIYLYEWVENTNVFLYGFKTANLLEDLNKCFVVNSAGCVNGGILRTTTTTARTAIGKGKEAINVGEDDLVVVEELEQNAFKIYPNPVKNTELNFAFRRVFGNEKLKIEMKDITGKKVFSKELQINQGVTSVQTSLPSSLAKGLYLLNYKLGDIQGVKKVLLDN